MSHHSVRNPEQYVGGSDPHRDYWGSSRARISEFGREIMEAKREARKNAPRPIYGPMWDVVLDISSRGWSESVLVTHVDRERFIRWRAVRSGLTITDLEARAIDAAANVLREGK